MNLLEMKKEILTLIEEARENEPHKTDDPDIEAKLNDVINMVMFELARMKKIPAVSEKEVSAGIFKLKELEDFFQLDRVRYTTKDGEEARFDTFGDFVEFPKEGSARFFYFKYPKRITDDTVDEEYTFELSDDALQLLPFGVAGDVLKSDVSNNYGQIYSQRYEQGLQRLDSRYTIGMVYIEGGIDI